MLDKRIEAARNGETIYQGAPCQSCGQPERYVSNNACVSCQREHTRKNRRKTREAIKQARRLQ